MPADAVEVSRQRREPRAGGSGLGDQPASGVEVRAELGRGHHLQRGDARLRHGVAAWFGVGSMMILVTLGSVQLPLTSNSCEKIWPSGFFSTFCAIAAATPATGLTIATPVGARGAPAPATGLTIATAVEAVPPRLGTTRTLSACVSSARPTRPDIAT